MKKKISKFTIFCAIMDFLTLTLLFVLYGPIEQFRSWWITTSLATGNHKYFANVLYSDVEIRRTLANNKIEEYNQNTKVEDIIFNNERKETYESIYEEQILKREEGNDLYKIVKIKEKNYNGFLLVVYDPSRISLAKSSVISGQSLVDIAKENNAVVAVNASGFSYQNGWNMVPTGTVIRNGKVESVGSRNTHGGGLIGFTKDHVLMLTTESSTNAIKHGMENAVTFGPFLIVNGVSAKVKGNGGWGINPRTAIAQRKDGIVLFLVIDGRGGNGSAGISIKDMITLLEKYGAYNAANLDGGGSSTLVENGVILNDPQGFHYVGDRFLPNGWIIK